mgnify:CR=1 FL=1
MVTVFPIRAFRDNYIWALQAPDGRRVAVVDPGDAAPVEAALAERGLELVAILITHHHADHVGGVEALCADRALPVYGPAGEAIPRRTHALVEGDRVELDSFGLSLEVIDVPGHTAGHIAYFGDEMLFCGDTLFAGGCGRVFEGTPQQMHRSLTKLASLPPTTHIYCAHEYTEANLRFALRVEPNNQALRARMAHVEALRARDEITLPSLLEDELATNPFLRTASQTVIESAAAHAGNKLSSPADVFAAVRAWKDSG